MEEKMKRKRKRTDKVVKEIKRTNDLLEIINYKISELLHKVKDIWRELFANGKFK